jgi:putative transposase
MARLARLAVPGYAHHVMVRGNNRQPIFLDDTDRLRWLALQAQYAAEFEVQLHAYVLMGNHVHLLLTPTTEQGLPKFMQFVGRQYVSWFNRKHQRTGTLWEGRYKSCLIQSERYLLSCMTYIDLNPVRAGMVAQPGDYPWSSFHHYAGKRVDPMLTPHPLQWRLGNTPFAREAAYTDMVARGLGTSEVKRISDGALTSWAMGDSQFLQGLQSKTPRRVSKTAPGRPRKQPPQP